MAVGTNPQAPALCQILHRRENPIAQIGFGGQAQPCHGLASGHARHFVGIGMGGMHQAPTRVDFNVVIQPLNRALATPAQAVIHFLALFRDVNVHRACGVAGPHDVMDLLRGDGTQ